ncbi:hypothetical protein B0A49_01768 [Cryomyces minteri]|uniref:PH domain-containing protein n=1 Tax=Cryomyces minteri TaxID=331657 RepID=A0A4U0Y0S5_9PEZI|nr:hypothetical protein B0A49_01768 [Cryomyces minteri]
MAAVVTSQPLTAPSQPRAIPPSSGLVITLPQYLPPHQSAHSLRNAHLTLDTFSPVNQNGSFEFDRVLKSGEVLKRTRKTKAWRTIYLVLRPNLLSIYKDKEETKLRHQINLSELTAVARQKDPKRKADHVFALFSPSRNFHLSATSDKEAQAWVELIRREARIDEGEEEMTLASPGGAASEYEGFGRHERMGIQETLAQQQHRLGYSSSDADPLPQPRVTSRVKENAPPSALHSARRASHTMDYSGAEHGSYSDFSDSAGPGGAAMSALSLNNPSVLSASISSPEKQHQQPQQPQQQTPSANPIYPKERPALPRNASQQSIPHPDSDRVIYHGWLFHLKSSRGVRRWKPLWAVLRSKALAFYKNEEEYSAVLIIPFPAVIDAVEVDPISKSKRFCMQVISEERNWRFCAPDEEGLAKWLGAFKSLLAKRKEGIGQRGVGVTGR